MHSGVSLGVAVQVRPLEEHADRTSETSNHLLKYVSSNHMEEASGEERGGGGEGAQQVKAGLLVQWSSVRRQIHSGVRSQQEAVSSCSRHQLLHSFESE